MFILRQGTAASFSAGPIVNSTTGAPETALTISQADVRIKKGAGNWAQKNESSNSAHEENGEYEVNFDTTDTNTVGIGKVKIAEAGTMVWSENFMVMSQAAYDFMYGSTALPVNVTAMAANVVTAAAVADGAIDAATFAAGAINASAIADGAIDAGALADDAITAAKIAADALAASELAASAVAEIAAAVSAGPSAATVAAAVWDKLRSAHNIPGSYGEAVTDIRQQHAGKVTLNSLTGEMKTHEEDDTTVRFTRTKTAVDAVTSAMVP